MELDDLNMNIGSKPNPPNKMTNVRKVKSRDAARNRRGKENLQYTELAKLLPLPENITSQLDKASIIRLTISFLRYRDMTGKGSPGKNKRKMNSVPVGSKRVSPFAIEKNLGLHMLQAMDGFLLCVSQEGKFIYISETVSSHLGMSQLDLIGSSIFNVIHPDDHKDVSQLLASTVQPSLSDTFLQLDNLNAMTLSDMLGTTKQPPVSLFIRMKCSLMKRGNCFNKNTGYKVIHVSGQMVPFKNVDHVGDRPVALVATGRPLPAPTISHLKLDAKVFVSRVGMDLKIAFCEGKIRRYMDFTAKDIVGMSAYEFYHLNDSVIVQDAHVDCLSKGKCASGVYRWMNKTGGWVWMQTVGTVLTSRSAQGVEESQILCVNYLCSEVEAGDEVMHTIQQRFKQLEIQDKPGMGTKDSLDDFGTELIPACAEDVVHAARGVPSEETVLDKDTYFLALKYSDQRKANSENMPGVQRMNDGFLGAQQLDIPSIQEVIPAWQENQNLDDANELANQLLLAEFEADKTVLKYPFENAPSSPDSGLFDMSPQPALNSNRMFSNDTYSQANNASFLHDQNVPNHNPRIERIKTSSFDSLSDKSFFDEMPASPVFNYKAHHGNMPDFNQVGATEPSQFFKQPANPTNPSTFSQQCGPQVMTQQQPINPRTNPQSYNSLNVCVTSTQFMSGNNDVMHSASFNQADGMDMDSLPLQLPQQIPTPFFQQTQQPTQQVFVNTVNIKTEAMFAESYVNPLNSNAIPSPNYQQYSNMQCSQYGGNAPFTNNNFLSQVQQMYSMPQQNPGEFMDQGSPNQGTRNGSMTSFLSEPFECLI